LFVSVRVFSLAAFGISLMVNGVAMIAGFDWPCVAALLAGWYLADFASGVVHMLLDYHPCPDGLGLADIFNYAGSRESAEYLGLRADRMGRLTAFQRVAYDFKTHHPRPDALGRRGLWHQIGVTLIAAALPASLALDALVLSGKAPGWLIALGVSLILGTAFAQHFHGSLHRRQVPRHIAVLRQLGLLMDPAAHQAHHDTLQRDFATNCGWSNPVVNRLFAALRAHGMLDDAGLEPQS
jgi:hypothetical protein